MGMIPIRRALLSVTDKTGLVELARGLESLGIEMISTGGTAAALRQAGLAVVDVAALTGMAEMLDGRVKTLHPRIHGGILADRDRPGHRADMEAHGIAGIDLVVVNLYAFEATVARDGVTPAEAVESIDIGGPGMIRAAAKNHRHVLVVTSPAQYGEILAALKEHGGAAPRALARKLAREAFHRTAAYDAAIAAYFDRLAGAETGTGFPERLRLDLRRVRELRYGENPHQPAALYQPAGSAPGPAVRQLHGKEISYTNDLDLDAALRLLAEFEDPAAVIIKHTNPCGVGFGDDLELAYRRALAADPLSAFGGVVGLNRPCDAKLAATLVETFLEMVLAPAFSREALETLEKKKNLRLLEAGPMETSGRAWSLRQLAFGYLVQERDPAGPPPALQVVTRRTPTDAERASLLAAWRIVKHVKSNAIVLADAAGSVGVGCGQTSRVDAVEDAIRKAGRGVGIPPGTVLASDAFFPFRDSVDAAHRAGIGAIIQPGGSVRDAESIAAADEHDMAMVFTGRRAFLH